MAQKVAFLYRTQPTQPAMSHFSLCTIRILLCVCVCDQVHVLLLVCRGRDRLHCLGVTVRDNPQSCCGLRGRRDRRALRRETRVGGSAADDVLSMFITGKGKHDGSSMLVTPHMRITINASSATHVHRMNNSLLIINLKSATKLYQLLFAVIM